MKIAAFILSLVILFNAVVPCTVVDNCEQEEVVATCCDNDCEKEETDPKEEKDCNDCPPFSICSAAYEFTGINSYAAQAPMMSYSSTEFFDHHIFLSSEYYSTPFQPPRFS